MQEVLEASGKRLGEHSSLSTVISAARAWGPNIRKLDHRYSQEFDLVEVTDSIGESFLCRNRKERVSGRATDRTGFWYLLRNAVPIPDSHRRRGHPGPVVEKGVRPVANPVLRRYSPVVQL